MKKRAISGMTGAVILSFAAIASASPVTPTGDETTTFDNDSSLIPPSGITIRIGILNGGRFVSDVASDGDTTVPSASFDKETAAQSGLPWDQQLVTTASGTGEICPQTGFFTATFNVKLVLSGGTLGTTSCTIGTDTSPMVITVSGTEVANPGHFTMSNASVTFPSSATGCGSLLGMVNTKYGLSGTAGPGRISLDGCEFSTGISFTGTCTS